jgi:hypothetical protein
MAMNVFEMVIVIVIIGCVTGVVNNWIKRRDRGRSNQQDQLRDRLEDLEDLEDRVRVLEAVITDQNYHLKQQFNELEKK